KYGFYRESVKSYTLSGKEGMEKIAAAMADLRKEPVTKIGGEKVAIYEDHSFMTRNVLHDGSQESTGLPKANALRYLLDGGAWVVVRPSGTEPKLKLYIGANADTENETADRAERLLKGICERIEPLLK
ncbi:MAG: phospho-sugar mutase, partial [Clostridia bacterium]|nr:phospho-sugar mutase [Clostridia bacterium]